MQFERRRFDNRRDRGFNFNRAPREMHKVICSECEQECEVPFKPTEGRPVFCRECFAKKRRF
ncbi:MAG: DNA-directed RNA polymerase [Candidatus Aenigmarchaeota archaeon]|nr:DNA-directed RNA polymerase [Candidatus Aenigmarchaeota archaeon]